MIPVILPDVATWAQLKRGKKYRTRTRATKARLLLKYKIVLPVTLLTVRSGHGLTTKTEMPDGSANPGFGQVISLFAPTDFYVKVEHSDERIGEKEWVSGQA